MKPGPKDGYLACAVREYYSDMATVRNGDPRFTRAVKLALRCYKDTAKERDGLENEKTKKKFRKPGGGRKTRVTNIRDSLFEWFVDVRTSLKAWLPKKMFLLKCKELYTTWLGQQSDVVQAEHEKRYVMFSKMWLKGWMRDYKVSLRHPNKRFNIKQGDRVERIEEYLKNVWMVKVFY